jgi:hypothetical protein
MALWMSGITGAGGIFHALPGSTPFLPEQAEQSEQSEQYEQSEQSEQSEQREQSEQSEQREQSEQSEQREQLVQFLQSFRLSSAVCAASMLPKYSDEHLLPLVSETH